MDIHSALLNDAARKRLRKAVSADAAAYEHMADLLATAGLTAISRELRAAADCLTQAAERDEWLPSSPQSSSSE